MTAAAGLLGADCGSRPLNYLDSAKESRDRQVINTN